MLEALQTPGAGGDGTVAVLLHGRGSHERDLQGLATRLPVETVVTPRAPHPGAKWGYGPGWAWYRYLGGDRIEAETLDHSLGELRAFLAGLGERLGREPERVVLGGFSQGGSTSLAYAMRHPGEVAAVLNFSGFVVDALAVELREGEIPDTPLFWGHGTADPAVRHEIARKGRALLEDVGANLTSRDYDIGHWIAPEELDDARTWLESEVL